MEKKLKKSDRVTDEGSLSVMNRRGTEETIKIAAHPSYNDICGSGRSAGQPGVSSSGICSTSEVKSIVIFSLKQ